MRDFPDRHLIPIEPTGNYPHLAPFLGKIVRAHISREHCDNVLRLVASLESGHVAPSPMLRALAAYERQNQLDVASSENRQSGANLVHAGSARKSGTRRTAALGLLDPIMAQASGKLAKLDVEIGMMRHDRNAAFVRCDSPQQPREEVRIVVREHANRVRMVD